MHDANVLPYGSDSAQPADPEHAETTEPYYQFGDTPAFRRTGITDQQAADHEAERYRMGGDWA